MSNIKLLLDRELHDMAQPITSFQCRLEIGLLLGGEQALNEAAMGGLEDLRRITSAVARMRQLVTHLRMESEA